ncbi:hypothetical protein TraAM80_04805 [Trypanosoma rangeli]|uniref:Uncharacterized protein n=1 Tax=Trypanosoma rangeli TaxID=5698 RepID=A0A422NHK7_TRYRA|nr:uncharacterized protein TraAM80_04805 [Trypanosoma rangeli]RNF04952.1 hypothetical protein TraAM80_04805 [Trypanosoma rangeli]|eukprot:RNF04952.1 hypothetical protein TraAM80_04805 [Trypanosoma rangeli]
MRHALFSTSPKRGSNIPLWGFPIQHLLKTLCKEHAGKRRRRNGLQGTEHALDKVFLIKESMPLKSRSRPRTLHTQWNHVAQKTSASPPAVHHLRKRKRRPQE